MKLTQEQADKYLKNGGVRCPYCNSDDISGDSVEVDIGSASQEMFCHDCNATWNDLYTLSGISVGSIFHKTYQEFAVRNPEKENDQN